MLRSAEPRAGRERGAAESSSGSPSRARSSADLVAVVIAIVGLELVVVQAGGGRDEGAVTKGLLTLIPALVLTRPWARLPIRILLVAGLPALGALYLCLFSPLQWAGADQLATAAYAGLLFLTVAAAGSSHQRRRILFSCLAGTGAFQALYALWVWQADGNLSEQLSGTYYNPNPFAAHVAASGLLLVTAYLAGPARARNVTLAGSVLCLVAVGMCSSRASYGLILALGLLIVVRLLVTNPGDRRRIVLRVAILTLLTAPLVVGATGLQTHDQSAGADAASAGSARFGFYASALQVTRAHPVVGVGAGAVGPVASSYQGPLEPRARNVHNGVLQAAAEGGVPLAVAYTLPLLLAAVAFLRRGGRRTVTGSDRFVLLGAGGGAGLLTLHSLVDFDWTFPALPALLAALIGVVIAVPRPQAQPDRLTSRTGICAACLLLLGGLALAISVRADAADTAVRSSVVPDGSPALVGVSGPLRDRRFDRLVLRDESAGSTALRTALRRTADLAERDSPLQWQRASALLRLGEREDALALAKAQWARVRENTPLQAIGYSKVLDAAGDSAAAEAALAETATRLVSLGPGGARLAEPLVLMLLNRPGGDTSAPVRCLVAAVTDVLPKTRLPDLPPQSSSPCSSMPPTPQTRPQP